MTVFTVGYEDFQIDKFVEFLRGKKIEEVADVRKNPVSRKKGFSKNKLAAALAGAGISYLHYGDLGVPKAWRDQNKDHKLSRERMFKKYETEILPRQTAALSHLMTEIKAKKVALLCFESEPTECHRSFVAKNLKRKSRGKLKLIDLYSPVSAGRR